MSKLPTPRDSVSPTSGTDMPAQRQHKRFGDVMRRLGHAIRRRSPEPSAMDLDTSPHAARLSHDAHDEGVSTPTSLRQPSINSFESRGSAITVISHVPRQSTRDERAQFFRARYGLTMDPTFTPERAHDSVARVQKRPRLRMHVNCHLCNTPFRASSYCPQCRHQKCRMCPKALPKGVQALIDQTKQHLEGTTELHDDLALLRIACGGHEDGQSRRPPNEQAAVANAAIPRAPCVYPSMGPAHRPGAHNLYTRECCTTIEQAIGSLCKRQEMSMKKFHQLSPLSFQALARWALKARQERVFKLPKITIRHPCRVCGRSMSYQYGPCRVCDNPALSYKTPMQLCQPDCIY